jgi:signal transduction histidine kinase
MKRINGVNLLALRLMMVVFSLVFLTGFCVFILLSGSYHGQIMETHIEELFYLAEHNLEAHTAGDHSQNAPQGFGVAPVDNGQIKAWSGDPKLMASTKAMEPVQWNNGRFVQIYMGAKAMLGLEEGFSYFRIYADDLAHDYLHAREESIDEIVAVFPANLMMESMNLYYMGSLSILILVSVCISLPFVFVVRRQVISPLSQLIHDMTSFSEKLFTPNEKKSLVHDGSIIADARLALQKLQGETQKELVHREKLAAAGREVANINHYMRNVLSSSMLLADSLMNSEDQQVKEAAPMVIASIERAVMFCNRTLEFLKPENTLKPSMVSVASIIDEVSGYKDIPLEYNGPPKMWVDEHQFFRLLNNLVVNAVDAGASIISINARKTDNHVVIDLADNGPGISAGIRENLFKPFHAERRGSTGLGLSIAREIAISHGGDLRLNSTGSEGSVFRILFTVSVLEDQTS